MRIRLLSGQQKGQIVDMDGAELLLSNGLAEHAPPELAPPIAVAASPDPPVAEAEGASLADEDDPPSEDPPAPRVPGRLRSPRVQKAHPATGRRKRR